MKLTKEQKAGLIEKLSSVYGCVKLRCDGYEVSLQIQRASKSALKFVVMVYVNGQWRGAWMNEKESFPEQKFMNRRTYPCCKPAMKAAAEKAFGKRAVAKDPFYNGVIVVYSPTFPSGKAAINHLCKVCESIEIIADEGGV